MKRITSVWNLLLILILISGYSCKKKGTDPDYFITLETPAGNQLESVLTVVKEGLTQSFQLKSNGSWRIATKGGDVSWLAIHPNSGNQNGSFSLAIETNTGPKREAQLAFTVDGQELAILEIKQEGLEIVDPVVTSFKPLLDLTFKEDGTAEDISQFKHPISSLAGVGLNTVYSNTYKRYVARFNHADGAATPSGFFKMDYSSNQTFKNALSDGHTLEAVFMSDFEGALPNRELKMFSSHESGGTGLMIGNNAQSNAIVFLPHVGTGYAWTNSGITPVRGKYYHVVGVWNKQEGKTYIYVDGVLKASANTTGDFNLAKAGSDWFGVGVDAAGANGQTGWKGDVAISRIYDKPLDAAEVQKLWKQVEGFTPSPDDISGVSLISKLVRVNTNYTITGNGFLAGDKIKMVPVSEPGAEYLADGVVTSSSVTFKIPANFTTGRYRFYVVRGGKNLDIGFATLTVVTNVNAPKIIAHRGYWKTGAPQNSIAGLIKAQELKIYGSEFDVYITTDGKLVLNHDATINGITIENSTYDQIKDITLGNGEKLPTLENFLIQGKTDPSTKLILEIKTHSNSLNGVSNNERVSKAVVDLVNQLNIKSQVEYIAFSLDVCKKILQFEPTAMVSYLNGNLSPQELFNQGIKGIDYSMSVIRQKTDWITQAQQLGMIVNVWTVNSEADLQEAISYGVDFITTDDPVLAKSLVTNK